MSKWVTLLEQEESTMVSSWTCIITCRSTRGGWCILETHSESVDVPNEDDEEYAFYEDPYESCSEIIKTKEEFLAAWKKGCEVLCIDADIDDKVIAKVETICPKIAKSLRENLTSNSDQ